MKWHPTCRKIPPDKLKMVSKVVFTSLNAGYLYLSEMSTDQDWIRLHQD